MTKMHGIRGRLIKVEGGAETVPRGVPWNLVFTDGGKRKLPQGRFRGGGGKK